MAAKKKSTVLPGQLHMFSTEVEPLPPPPPPPLPAQTKPKVLAWISRAGAIGATCEETEKGTHLRHQSVSARIFDLHNADVIAKSGIRRKNRSGKTAIVWVTRAVKDEMDQKANEPITLPSETVQ